jgi:hypothetical protein
LHHGLNPPHDTRHDTRLPVLTEVDESIAPLEELDDSTKGLDVWHGAGFCCEDVRWSLTDVHQNHMFDGPLLMLNTELS